MQLRKNFEILYSVQPATFSNKSTSCDLSRPFLTFCDPLWLQQTSWYLSRPTSCDRSLPLGTSAALLWPQLSVCDLQWSHRTRVDLNNLSWPPVTLPILNRTSNDLNRPHMTSADLLWPHLTYAEPFQTLADLIWPHVTSFNIMWEVQL